MISRTLCGFLSMACVLMLVEGCLGSSAPSKTSPVVISVEGLSALEVDVYCSRSAGACLSRAWLSEAVNPSDSFPKFRKLFRSEYQQRDSEDK